MFASPLTYSAGWYLGLLWRGRIALSWAFWLHLVLGSILCLVAAIFISGLIWAYGPPESKWHIIWGVMFLARIAYPIFAAIGAWRSATREGDGSRGFFYKLGIVFVLLVFGLSSIGLPGT